MGIGRLRDQLGINESTTGPASLRGGQTVMHRPDLSTIQDAGTAHALRLSFDYIEQLRGALGKSEDSVLPELAVPEANPLIPGGGEEPTPESCSLVLGEAPSMEMSFAFAGENGFAPGDGFLYTGNQVQGRIEIVEYFGIPNTQATEIGQFDFPGGFLNMRVAVWGDTMYVTNGANIEILDVSDRTNPSLDSTMGASEIPDYLLAFNQSINNVCLCKPILASASGTTDKLTLYSLQGDPFSPALLDQYPDPLDPTQPAPDFSISTGINAQRRGVLYTLSGAWLTAFNISNPTNIKRFSRLNIGTGFSFRSFYQAYGYGYVYMATSLGGSNSITIANVKDPSDMFIENTDVNCTGAPQTMSVEGSFLFVVAQIPGGDDVVDVFDITTPTVPSLVTTVQLPTSGSYTWGLLTYDGAYVAHDHTTGAPVLAFFSIEYPPCCNCAPSLFTAGRV